MYEKYKHRITILLEIGIYSCISAAPGSMHFSDCATIIIKFQFNKVELPLVQLTMNIILLTGVECF
jgi:hypothetical protein